MNEHPAVANSGDHNKRTETVCHLKNGKRRATQDVDIVAAIQRQHVQTLVKLHYKFHFSTDSGQDQNSQIAVICL